MKLTIKDIEFDTKDLTDEQREQLKAELGKPKRWVPGDNDRYLFIDHHKGIIDTTWDDDSTDRYRLSQGNVFKTREEAKAHIKYLEALAVIKEDAEWWEPDWGDGDQVKCFAGYLHSNDDFVISSYTYLQTAGPVYFETEEALRRSLEKHKTEWLIIFGVKED